MNKRKRFFQGHTFGGGWSYEHSPITAGYIVSKKYPYDGELMYITHKFFRFRIFTGEMYVIVTIDFINLKFDNDGNESAKI